MYKLAKILQTSCFTKLALQHVKEAFPDMYSSPILPYKFPRTDAKLTLLHKHMPSKAKQQLETNLQSSSYKHNLKRYLSTGSISSALLKVTLTEESIVTLQKAFFIC